jgi:uncharacterized protein (TIGR02453 family)
MQTFKGFSAKALTFLRQLKKNNRKDWFEANRDVYESELRQPMRALVEEMDVRLATIAPEIVGDPKRSLFRIHRDIRFSADKSPYKTHASFWVTHRAAARQVGSEAESGGAGFYFHFEPGGSMSAGGIWMPPRPVLARIRDSIVDDLHGFIATHTDRAFKRRFGTLGREHTLTRMPRGYAPDHPAGDWLRLTSFTVSAPLTDTDVTSPKLADRLARDFALMVPLVRWLNAALGYRLAERR